MILKLRAWLPKAKMMIHQVEKDNGLQEIIKDNNNNNEEYILMQATGVKDRHENSVFSGDYILYDSGFNRKFFTVKETPLGFYFCCWDKYKKRWKHSTYTGINVYGQIVGNIYEGVKSKRIYKEMKEVGIFKEEE